MIDTEFGVFEYKIKSISVDPGNRNTWDSDVDYYGSAELEYEIIDPCTGEELPSDHPLWKDIIEHWERFNCFHPFEDAIFKEEGY